VSESHLNWQDYLASRLVMVAVRSVFSVNYDLRPKKELN